MASNRNIKIKEFPNKIKEFAQYSKIKEFAQYSKIKEFSNKNKIKIKEFPPSPFIQPKK